MIPFDPRILSSPVKCIILVLIMHIINHDAGSASAMFESSTHIDFVYSFICFRDLMANFTAKKAAITTAITEELGACRSWVVFITIVFEIMSHLMVMVAAWVSTAYVIPVYLLLHFLIATQVTDLSVRRLLEAPLLWLFPSSRLVSSRPRAARSARLCSWLLRWAMFGIVLTGRDVWVEYVHDGDYICYNDPRHSCQGLPPWLQTPQYKTWWHGGSPSCLADPEVYGSCLTELPWFTRSYCNAQAGYCAVLALPLWLRDLSRYVLAVGPVLGLVVGTLLNLCTCCCKQLAEVPGTQVATMNTVTGEVGWVKKASYTLMIVGPFYLDVILDMNGILQYVLTGNFMFSAGSAIIFFTSLHQQVARGAVQKLWNATLESVKLGQSTDDLEVIMLSEKSVEAPLQLLLQFYAFPFVTSSDAAVFSFICSLLLSFKSVAEATYWLAELKLHDAIATQEYESLPWALWDDEKKMACTCQICSELKLCTSFGSRLCCTVATCGFDLYIYIYLYVYFYMFLNILF